MEWRVLSSRGMRALALVAAIVALPSCGGSTASDAASSDGGGDAPSSLDASGDHAVPGDGGCVAPTAGQACTVAEIACQPSDPCCAGYEWVCSGTWQQAALGCACFPDAGRGDAAAVDAGSFACGPMTCGPGTYCTDRPPGIVALDGSTPPDAFTCESIPAACASSPTCGCIEGTLSAQDSCSTKTPGVTCSGDGAGHVTIRCLGV